MGPKKSIAVKAMAVMILMKVYMETVVVNNTKYDVLVEEEARLVRLLPIKMIVMVIMVPILNCSR